MSMDRWCFLRLGKTCSPGYIYRPGPWPRSGPQIFCEQGLYMYLPTAQERKWNWSETGGICLGIPRLVCSGNFGMLLIIMNHDKTYVYSYIYNIINRNLLVRSETLHVLRWYDYGTRSRDGGAARYDPKKQPISTNPTWNRSRKFFETLLPTPTPFSQGYMMFPAIPIKRACTASWRDQKPTFLKRRLRACSSTTSRAKAS